MHQQLILGWVTSFQHHRAGQHQPNPAQIPRYFQGWTGPRCVGPVPEGVPAWPRPPGPSGPPQMLTEHVDVSLGDRVEAAAGQQDHVRLAGFRHGAPVRSDPARSSQVLFVRERRG